MCKRVVFPALSSPKKRTFPDFFHRPSCNYNCCNIEVLNLFKVYMNFTQLFKNSGEKFPDEHFVPIKRNISIANVKYDE